MTNYNSGFSPITNFLTDSVNYGKVGELAVKDYLSQQDTAMAADGLVKRTGIEADATKKMAKYEAEAIKARGAAAGKAAIWKGVGSAAGSIGSGFAKSGGFNRIFEGTPEAAQNVASGYSPGLGVPLDAYFGPGSYSGKP